MAGGLLVVARPRAGLLALLAMLAMPALLAGLLLGPAAPALAHTQLDNAVPTEGETLTKSPGNLQLVFTEPVDPSLATVVVRGPDGRDLARGPARQLGSGLVQPVAPSAEAGRVRVFYRVVSLDGHPVTGSYSFEVLRGDPNAAQGGPDAGEDEGTTPAAGGSSGSSTLLLGAGAVLALLGAGALLARRRRAPATP
ncbi:MAG: copper resistance protein CopC [Actinomycetota bacterium]|nr:copper resistance protein CopC [Actinomycetota bacterium]